MPEVVRLRPPWRYSGSAGSSRPPDAAGGERRVVLHVDIDAFFAGIEQQLDPRLAGRPVIVGAGVIASCSYEARRYGLKAGMPTPEARAPLPPKP